LERPVTDLLRARHAGRAIDSRPLPEEVIADLVEAVRLTPSCSNNQPWRFLFLESPEARASGAQIFTGGNRAWAPRAPLIVVGYSKASDDCRNSDGRLYHQFDTGMAAMNLMLAATSHDLCARPMAGFDPARVRELFGLSAEDEPIVAIAVGYLSADESHLPDYYKGAETRPRVRKEAGEVVRRL
jgi:glutaredoxin-dependent peroxiredoxin